MIEHLFGSKTRVKLLHVFYTNPNRSFYVREVTRKVDEQINSVRRELSNLLSIGVIKSSTSGNRLYYEVNQNHPHYQSLRAIFTNLDAEQEAELVEASSLTSKFQELGSVAYAQLSGVFTKDPVAPVDVLIVGDINRTKLEKLIAELEEEEARELRYTVLSREEFDYRHNLNDRFLSSALDAKKTVVVDRIGLSAPTEPAEAKSEPATEESEPKSKAKSKKPKAKKE